MADSHPKSIDPRPKRRRDKDNPYTIFTTGINTATPALLSVLCRLHRRGTVR